MDAADVRLAAETCAGFLGDHLDADWSAPVPDLDMTIAEVVAHAARGCVWYAFDLTAGGPDLEAFSPQVSAAAEPTELVAVLVSCAGLTAAAIDAAPGGARGFHPAGQADPSGFAGMACDEMLIHTDDVGRALEVPFAPPHDLAERVLQRLFPWVADEGDPWDLLRWANGRITLGGEPRLEGWKWHGAPLDEWDGTVPRRET